MRIAGLVLLALGACTSVTSGGGNAPGSDQAAPIPGCGSGQPCGSDNEFPPNGGEQPPADTCSSSSVGGLTLDLETAEAVTGTVIDQSNGATACSFSAVAGKIEVNLGFFYDWSCAIPTPGTSYRLRMVGDTTGRTSTVDVLYASSMPTAGADFSVGYDAGDFHGSGVVPLDHIWVNNACGDAIVDNSADIGGPPPVGPLTAIEATIGPL
ncbi:MAG TPA: hypothetical protein VGM90_33240 [Kofleriaceae bacterium]|jgi:hypothetical protein